MGLIVQSEFTKYRKPSLYALANILSFISLILHLTINVYSNYAINDSQENNEKACCSAFRRVGELCY